MEIQVMDIIIILAVIALIVCIVAIFVAIVLMVKFIKVTKNLDEITTILAKDVKEIDKGVKHVFGLINVLGGGLKKVSSLFKKKKDDK